ncbi:UDP-N-acetylmuramate--L-alanine ligase [Sphingobacterium sp. SGG-5]|uniref:UDP-N-acetylmuramate--L-alanine ligase n=1 Tax=Sphingobacterium sp. SGG-5 TaxID=2710881 RepID=UPI0013EC0BE0|nr:UDP-N-acetylmuramate--L-alanine ligase [Sphingobacterium sp. SGG-5]NGM60354.1 UDP-N-acetylmuramate--L-alanine ligase [Sphingobacterium sp. SGG-5]
MNIDQVKRVYLLGIGGIGMSGLARYFHQLGCAVYGYDRTETELTAALVEEGMSIIYTDDVDRIPSDFVHPATENLIIFTPAVPKDLKIKQWFEQRGFDLFKRSEVLGLLSANRFTIGVAGTHGKTTTSTMIAHILKDSGYDCSAFLGGISSNYNTNVLFGENNVIVVEADEYDRSFLTLHPNIAVITSADADHLDIYGDRSHLIRSFELYLDRVVEGGKRIVKLGLPFVGDISYSREQAEAKAYARNIEIIDGDFYFDYVNGEMCIKGIKLGLPGLHNVENAVAAVTVAFLLGIDQEKVVVALANFKGVKRRFEYIVKSESHIYIDDYAHHPEELRAFLSSIKKLYPNKKLTVVFQPHLFSRTRDFVDGFAEVLAMADELLLMEIYPARELPIEGVDSQWLLDQVALENKRLVTPQEVLNIIEEEKPELVVTMGAGDIDRLVQPIKRILENNK